MNNLNVKIWGNNRKDCWNRLCEMYGEFTYVSETPITRKDGALCGFSFEIILK